MKNKEKQHNHNWRNDIDSLTGEKIKICEICGAIKDSDNGIIKQ